MEKKKLCVHCGASMMVNSYSLNKTLLRALIKMARRPGKPARDLNFTKSEYSVYTKLKFWGFIYQLDDGLWALDPSALKFLNGHLRVPKEFTYFRDKVLAARGSTNVWEIIPTDESRQKYREMMKEFPCPVIRI